MIIWCTPLFPASGPSREPGRNSCFLQPALGRISRDRGGAWGKLSIYVAVERVMFPGSLPAGLWRAGVRVDTVQ